MKTEVFMYLCKFRKQLIDIELFPGTNNGSFIFTSSISLSNLETYSFIRIPPHIRIISNIYLRY